MSETTKTAESAATEANAPAAMQTNPEASIAGAAGFAAAESAEILNLLGDDAAGGSCCGGSCCSA